jgi:membrane complex biogenesis BtpA family protein
MLQSLHPQWKDRRHIVIGMIHLPPLPGAPMYRGQSLEAIRDHVLRDVETLVAGGVHGLMIENFGDVPFYPGRVPACVIAHMTMLAAEVRRAAPQLPLGINVLRNDGLSALAVAHAVGASFIRVNVLCSARVTDQGIIQGIAHDLLRERAALSAMEQIKILADVDVKHSAPLAPRPLQDEVDDLIERALANAVIVSGAGTGKATDPQKVRQVKDATAGRVPVLIGSGITAETLKDFVPHAEGFIVGTALKAEGKPTNPVELERVKRLMAALTPSPSGRGPG